MANWFGIDFTYAALWNKTLTDFFMGNFNGFGINNNFMNSCWNFSTPIPSSNDFMNSCWSSYWSNTPTYYTPTNTKGSKSADSTESPDSADSPRSVTATGTEAPLVDSNVDEAVVPEIPH